MQATIQALVDRAADHFSASLKRFKPWHGGNTITERNLSFQFGTAFLRHFPDGLVFMEAPFLHGDRKRADTHIDSYLFSQQLAVMLECKVVWAKDHIDSIASDMARLSPEVLRQIQDRHRGEEARVAKNSIATILAETWRLENVEWWCGDAAKKPGWSRDLLPKEGWTYGSRKVFREHDGPEGTLYWLYACRSISSEPVAQG